MSSGYNVAHLIGIPWGYGPPPESADCFSLAIYAQKVLWEREIDVPALGDPSWTEESLKRKSQEVREALPKFADRVTEQQEGDMVVFVLAGYTHLGTMIDRWHILHIVMEKQSRVSKLAGWPVDSFWRVRRS